MRNHYDFSTGVRGKYIGRIDAKRIHVLGSADSTQPNATRRDPGSEIRQKRGDTLVGTLRKTYGPGFAPGVRSDTRLDTLRKRANPESLSKLLKIR